MGPVALLHALAAHPDGISGQELARQAGCTRAAIWKDIERLRAEGLGIVGGHGGYQLVDSTGWGPYTLAWRCGRPVEHHTECASTNRIARDLAAALPAGAPLPIVVADHQTAGRGRRGRTWADQPGQSLLFSMVLRPNTPPHAAPRAVLLWAAAMAEVLDISLKWPNDLVVREGTRMRKVGGILAEMESSHVAFDGPARTVSVVLGVGINLSQRQFDGLPDATSLAMLGRTVPDRAALLGSLVHAIDNTDLHAPHALDAWRARACMLGLPVRVGEVEGIAEDIREDGALMVSGKPVLAGDVALVAAASSL